MTGCILKRGLRTHSRRGSESKAEKICECRKQRSGIPLVRYHHRMDFLPSKEVISTFFLS